MAKRYTAGGYTIDTANDTVYEGTTIDTPKKEGFGGKLKRWGGEYKQWRAEKRAQEPARREAKLTNLTHSNKMLSMQIKHTKLQNQLMKHKNTSMGGGGSMPSPFSGFTGFGSAPARRSKKMPRMPKMPTLRF